ncbi:MAG: DUF2309 domain-containing protein [Bacteroidia bacterium]|nr:DUF2309 domain-containing protein [Bacteroidia bacterium]
MNNSHSNKNGISATIHELKHYLPSQAPLKDFIHHNTLHAFQHDNFHTGIRKAAKILGYKVYLNLGEFRDRYKKGEINDKILDSKILQIKGQVDLKEFKSKMLTKKFETNPPRRVGTLRSIWKKEYQIDLDSQVHPFLFRILCSYLDQGISIWNFPVTRKKFLDSIREMERNCFTSFFKTERAKRLLLNEETSLENLLKIIVGRESLYKEYLFDQQFAHQGWSGLVSTVEDLPETLLDTKQISLEELIFLELIMEIDNLDNTLGNWQPICSHVLEDYEDLFSPITITELDEVLEIWQEAFEWSYYDRILKGIQEETLSHTPKENLSFQGLFCIDDRECSLRRHLEYLDNSCETFGTPGFFGVEFYYQPEHSKFYTKLCPAPVTPKYLIKQIETKERNKKDVHFTQRSHSMVQGWLISQTVGFWSAFQLFRNIFKPSISPATTLSFKHMDKECRLTIENEGPHQHENGLQIGFTVEEMANRVEANLRSIGLVRNFASIVYVVGHGASSVNNPHYAAYDCGACSGRPGSVNARVFATMANHNEVRAILKERGLEIPSTTQFVSALHDTTRDEIMFYDESSLSNSNYQNHLLHEETFRKALDLNAKERSRRFMSIDTELPAEKIHKKILDRSVSLFEPRPELNHATNALCIVGRRELSRHLFLDRRSFLNSFDPYVDPEGKYLLNILKAAAPVCGGINLEYYFSRVDNRKLGAGTKLPHNVMGLFGVANGIDGDLRPGLPSQMIEVHDPVRLLIIVEHDPDILLETIQKNAETYEWFINEWVHLVAVHPETRNFSVFKEGVFKPYLPINEQVETTNNPVKLVESSHENLPVTLLTC